MNKIIKKGAIVKKINCLAAAAAILLCLTGCEQGRIQEKGYLRAAAVTENNDTFLTLGLFSQEKTVTASAVKRMKKAELVDFAAENGIELDPKATNAEMADVIISALEL